MAMGRIAYVDGLRDGPSGERISAAAAIASLLHVVLQQRRGLQHWDRRLEQLEVIPKTIHFVFVDRRLKFSLRSLFLYIICRLYVEAFPLFLHLLLLVIMCVCLSA